MRRWVLFIALIVSICTVGYAENIDLSGMNTDALIELRNRIDDEISARVEKDNEVPLLEGYYVVGTDIAEGNYEIKDGSGPDDPQFNNGWIIYVFQSQEKLDEYVAALREYQSAYIDAQNAEASGKEASYPTSIYITDYLDNQVNIGSGESVRVALSNGQVMRVVKDNSRSDVTISKSTGLFMD